MAQGEAIGAVVGYIKVHAELCRLLGRLLRAAHHEAADPRRAVPAPLQWAAAVSGKSGGWQCETYIGSAGF